MACIPTVVQNLVISNKNIPKVNPIIPGLFDAFFARGHISTLAYAINLKFGTKVVFDKSNRKKDTQKELVNMVACCHGNQVENLRKIVIK